jgi:hypothetical protein
MDSWIGVGYGSPVHINSDMNIVEFIPGEGVKVSDTWSTGYTAPKEDKTFGGTDDIKNIKYSQENGQNVVTYDRAFNTGDPYDKEVIPNIPFTVSFAWGNGRIGYHIAAYYKTQMILSKEDLAPTLVSEPLSQFDFWNFHGITMTIFWTGFSFIGYIFARFLRHLKSWIYFHWVGSGLTALFSIGVLAPSIKWSNRKIVN